MNKLPHLLFGILLLAGYVQAQEDPFNPTLFFPDTVEVMAAEPFQTPVIAYDVRWDDARREVTVLLPDSSATYPYPDEVVSFYELLPPRWQNRVVLTGYGEDGPELSESFVLNLQTGDITRYERQCGDNSPYDLFGELSNALWVLEATPAGYVLCATLTGERTPPLALPDDFTPLEQFGTYNSLSPDFTRVLFLGDKGEVYLYTFATEEIIPMGRLAGKQWYLQAFFWADNEHFVLSSRSHNVCSLYVMDVTQRNELTPALETSPECPYLQQRNGTTLVFSHSQPMSEDSPFITCTRAIYDKGTDEWQYLDYGTLCDPDFGSADGDGYYRAVADDLKSADVVRFNPATGEWETIFEGGEIEWVRWVSDDERFAVLVLDTNGQINRIPGTSVDQWYGMEALSLVLVELATGTIRYAIPVDWNSDLSHDIPSDITMLREDLLLVEIRELEVTPSLGDSFILSARHVQTQLVQLTDPDPMITEIGKVLAVLPGQSRLLIWTEASDTSTALNVYDIATGQSTPVLRRVDYTQYSVNVATTDNPDTAVVTVYPVVDGVVNRRQGVRYTIRF